MTFTEMIKSPEGAICFPMGLIQGPNNPSFSPNKCTALARSWPPIGKDSNPIPSLKRTEKREIKGKDPVAIKLEHRPILSLMHISIKLWETLIKSIQIIWHFPGLMVARQKCAWLSDARIRINDVNFRNALTRAFFKTHLCELLLFKLRHPTGLLCHDSCNKAHEYAP
jgi:hypothetical protein